MVDLFSFRPLAKLLELFDHYPPFAGIDFGTSSTKLLIADRQDGRPLICGFASFRTPEGSVVDREPVDPEPLVSVLGETLRTFSVKVHHAVVSVSSDQTILRVLNLPTRLSEIELEDRIYEEVERFLPFSVEEVYLDYQPIGPSPSRPDHQDYLVVAARRESVDRILAVLEGVGLEPVIIDVEAFALLNGLMVGGARTAEGAIALLDLGAAATTFYLFDRERPVLQRSAKIGGRDLLQRLEETLGLPHEEALQLQQQPSRWEEAFRKEVFFPFLQDLIQQAQLLLQAAPPEIPFDRISMSGGMALIPGMAKLLEQALQKRVETVNPFAQAVFSPDLDSGRLINTAPLWGRAAGLAYRYLQFDGTR